MNREIVIYGAGRMGRRLEEELAGKDCRVLEFWDVNEERLKYKDYAIIAPCRSALPKNTTVIVALAMERAANAVKEQLLAKGYQNVILCQDAGLQNALCAKRHGKGCAQCLFTSMCSVGRSRDSKAQLKALSVNLTPNCTLNCRHCLALVPEAKRRGTFYNMKPQELERAMRALAERVGVIGEYSVVGGEPLLNTELCRIIGILLEADIECRTVDILSNGTVPISKELLRLLEGKVRITIDDYGNKLPDKRRAVLRENIRLLEENNCNYQVIDNGNGTWYDYGGFENRGLTAEQIGRRFRECVTGECLVLTPEGYLGRCGRHMSMVSLGVLDDGEYMELLKENVSDMEMDGQLKTLLEARTLTACNHCNGFDVNKLVSAGVQCGEEENDNISG